MKSFEIYNDRVEIVKKDGNKAIVYFNENSGKVYYRYKIGSITGIKHPGIFLGIDSNRQGYFLHNHYHYGKAYITTERDFRKGMPIYLYTEKCSNTPFKVIEIGLNQILSGESYKPISYNCQTFANTACYNERKSADANKWIGIAAAVIGVAFIGLVAGKK